MHNCHYWIDRKLNERRNWKKGLTKWRRGLEKLIWEKDIRERKEEDRCRVTNVEVRSGKYVGKGSSIFISRTRSIRVSRIQGVSSTHSFSLSLFSFSHAGCGTVYMQRKPFMRHRILYVMCTYAHIPTYIAFYIYTLSYRITVFVSLYM